MTKLELVPKGEFIVGFQCVLRKQENYCGCFLVHREVGNGNCQFLVLVFCCRFSLNNYFIFASLLTSLLWTIGSPMLHLFYMLNFTMPVEKFLLNLTWVRCSLLNKSAVGRVKGHLNKMVVPI